MRLYGVIHGGIDYFAEQQPHFLPTPELITDILAQPEENLGVECLSPEEGQALAEYAYEHSTERGLRAIEFYSDTYWENLRQRIDNKKVIPIDSKELYQQFLDILIAQKELQTYEKPTTKEERLDLQTRIHQLQAAMDNIYYLQRDAHLFQKAQQHTLVIAGLGHTDHWVSQKLLQPTFYGTETYDEQKRHILTTTRKPADHLRREQERIQRTLHYFATGKLLPEEPTYTGTWNINDPSKGYFELIITHQQGNTIEGIIEDMETSATFTGQRTAHNITFIKTRQQEGRKPIHYQLALQGNNIYQGTCNVEGEAMKHYAILAPGRKTPTALRLLWKQQ